MEETFALPISGPQKSAADFFSRSSKRPTQELILALASRYREIQDETAEILVIVAGPRSEALRVQRDHHLPFPVLPDEQGAAHRMFGVVANGALMQCGRPGKLATRRQGVVLYRAGWAAHVGSDPRCFKRSCSGTGRPRAAVRRALERIACFSTTRVCGIARRPALPDKRGRTQHDAYHGHPELEGEPYRPLGSAPATPPP
jgi:peroxiredoxin